MTDCYQFIIWFSFYGSSCCHYKGVKLAEFVKMGFDEKLTIYDMSIVAEILLSIRDIS